MCFLQSPHTVIWSKSPLLVGAANLLLSMKGVINTAGITGMLTDDGIVHPCPLSSAFNQVRNGLLGEFRHVVKNKVRRHDCIELRFFLRYRSSFIKVTNFYPLSVSAIPNYSMIKFFVLDG